MTEKMKFYAAIDWRVEYNSGFTYLPVEAKTKAEALLKAPEIVCQYARLEEFNRHQDQYNYVADANGMKNVWCIHLLGKRHAADDRGIDLGYYSPLDYAWKEGNTGDWYF